MTVFVLLAAHKGKFKQLEIYSSIEKAKAKMVLLEQRYSEVKIIEREILQ